MPGRRPTLIRIPFSHYCQKVEWAFTQAGIDYDCIDIPLQKMVRLPDVTRTGLVPALLTNDRLIEGSGAIMEWAATHAANATLPLFPEGHAAQARKWQDWADEAVGPVARREAYRVAYNDPWHFTNNPAYRLAAKLANRLILGVVKYYKMRRFEEQDADAVPDIVHRIATGLQNTGTGYLTTTHATAADHSVAALARPLLYAAPGRTYHDLPGWQDVVDHIDRVRPRRLTRRSKRRIKETDWSMLAAAVDAIPAE